MRRAIVDCIDDPEDLRELSQVSRAWRQDIVDAPLYANVVRRMLVLPNYTDATLMRDKDAELKPLSAWPGLPCGYSHLGMTLLLLQLADDPQKLCDVEPNMQCLRLFLETHCPKSFRRFEQYGALHIQALQEARGFFWSNTPIYAVIGFAWSMQLILSSGAAALVHGVEDEERYVLGAALTCFFGMTAYVTHRCSAELGDYILHDGERMAAFERKRRALCAELNPRTGDDGVHRAGYEDIVRRLLVLPNAQQPWPGLPADYTFSDVVLLLQQIKDDPSALDRDHPDMLWFRNFVQDVCPNTFDYLTAYQALHAQAVLQSRDVLYASLATYSVVGMSWLMQVGLICGAAALWRGNDAPDAPQSGLMVCLPAVLGASLGATCRSTFELRASLKDQDDPQEVFEAQRRRFGKALLPFSTQGLAEWPTDV